jgi:hypothetical protein
MKQIEIDIEVHRCIEGARKDFKESENDILRRLLGIGGIEKMFSHSNPIASFAPPVFEPKRSKIVLEDDLSEDISAYQINAMSRRIADANAAMPGDWMYKGAILPEGTLLQKWSRKQKYEALIQSGSICVHGAYFQSPSAAAMSVNGGTHVNGWDFWEYFDEPTKQWNKLSSLRKKAES